MATFTTDDLVKEMAKDYPLLKEKSLKKIINYGMRKIVAILRRRYDISLQIDRKNIFIYSPTTPEKQNKRMQKQLFRKMYKNEGSISK